MSGQASSQVGRHFLGWDTPVTDKVRAHLVPEGHSGPLRLDETLVVAPTRQAGRRLREHMARWCTDAHIALLSLRVKTPNYFLLGTEIPTGLASTTDILHAWTQVFQDLDITTLDALFPSGVAEPDMQWALSMGQRLHALRDQLLEGGWTITQVARTLDAQADEKARWMDLMKLEQAYLVLLRANHRIDPCAHKIELMPGQMIPPGVTRIVLACVADPTPLMIRQLAELCEHAGDRLTIEVLIHAPPELADAFDPWGRPQTDAWTQMDIPYPSEDHLILASDPAAQSRRVLQIIHQHAPELGPQDVAIGAPDGDVIPQLAATLEEQGMPAFNPAGISVRQHSLYQLLDAWQQLLGDQRYTSFRNLLRHPAMLHYLTRFDLQPSEILTLADTYQNQFLPQTVKDLKRGTENYAPFHQAVDHILALRKAYDKTPDTELAIRNLMKDLFQDRDLDQSRPADEDFCEVVQRLDHILEEYRNSMAVDGQRKSSDALHLVLSRFGLESWYSEHADSVVDLDGWLELSWNDAPLMIITGMNDQSVPDGRISDLFLPDSLRGNLKLRNADDRFARDVYLASSFIHSRQQNQGQIYFICGKVNSRGEPLRPSRLLLRCPDEQLTQRVERLFGDPPEQAENVAVSTAFKLDPSRIATAEPLTEIYVTRFSDYLACPFRYYLKHGLAMHALADDLDEMPQHRFGTIIHDALNAMARHPDMSTSTQAKEVADFMITYADRRFADYGSDLPLPVKIQRDAAHQRLKAAAREQVFLTEKGWRIVESEKQLSRAFDGVTISGKIDRIDYHDVHKRYRVLDYKTMDKMQDAEGLHFRSRVGTQQEYSWVDVDRRPKAWSNLQLPLYRFLVEEQYPNSDLRFGIFNLPKAVADTGIKEWRSFNEDLYASAMNCARGVIDDLRAQCFWPPTEKLRQDDFKELFFEQPEAFSKVLKVVDHA